MGLRADWLRTVLSVPYVPILGPAHPNQFSAEMFIDVFADILTASRTGTALPYDKDRRWSPRKTEVVLDTEIVHRPDYTAIPTLSRRGQGTVTVYYYGHGRDLDGLRAATRRYCAAHGAANGRVVYFNSAGTAQTGRTRMLLKEFAHDQLPHHQNTGPAVAELDAVEPATAVTFSAFAHSMADHGFSFLHRRRAAGHHAGPVLVSLDNGAVAGAIGPMTIMRDRAGARRLLPQYFGVLPQHRKAGHGRALWAAAMHWGARHHADYQLLQAHVGGASERLFLTEGLRSLGYTDMVAA